MIDGYLGTDDPSDSIRASDIDLIDVTGNLDGNIIIDNEATASASNTDRISIGGDVVGGGIYNNTGYISNIDVAGNVSSNLGDNPEFWSSIEILDIEIEGGFEGRIGSSGEGFSGHPDVMTVSVGGDFIGSSAMTMNSLETFEVGGDFDADITVSSVTGSSGFYSIGGEMASTASISLPAEGLEGQVIVNSAHDGDSWDGDVVVGSTTLAPNYTTLSSELGDGQVGIAPFNFHQRTSVPPRG